MKHVDEYRHPLRLKEQLAVLRRSITRRWVIMDVCGGQTHSLLRNGLEQALIDVLDLVHGPGCPVCVTPADVIDNAIDLAHRPDVILASFGDMLRVPGPRGSLLQARAAGANVRTVYSPIDAIQLAIQEPAKEVVFLGVGFETTAPATALAILQAQKLGLRNFSILVHHVRVLPAMSALMSSLDCRVEGFLAAGHVCTVSGFAEYDDFVNRFSVPVVVTGFEPLDLLLGLSSCVKLLETGKCLVVNEYSRSAKTAGNVVAQKFVDEVYEVATVPWRGLGEIPDGGLRLRQAYHHYDARSRFGLIRSADSHEEECRSGAIMAGQIKPPECPLFGTVCTPDHPIGAPMVSSEGACAAYFRYSRHAEKLT